MNPICFAFGSNLCTEQMVRRCPSAVVVGAGSLRGYRLAFAGFSATWNGAVATVVRARGESVPGLLYRISPIDVFEGVPLVYARHRRRVHEARTRAVRQAEVYELAAPWCAGAPSLEYAVTILRAYRRHGFALDALSSALAKSQDPSQ